MIELDPKKTSVPMSTITRDLNVLTAKTGSIYETITILARRADQISVILKEELHLKLEEFSNYTDSLEEVFENREQIEISRYYERLPKPSLIATQEFLEGRLQYKNPAKETTN